MLSNTLIVKRVAWIAAGVLLLAVIGAAVMYETGAKGKIVMATGGAGGAYHVLAERYKKDLARYGVTLELRPTVEGINTLQALFPQFRSEFKDFDLKAADIEAGFIKGTFVESLHGRLRLLRLLIPRHRPRRQPTRAPTPTWFSPSSSSRTCRRGGLNGWKSPSTTSRGW